MSEQQSTPLLWINKDASNVHQKKHVAKVNAHVQKSGSKQRTSRTQTRSRKAILPAHKAKSENKSQQSPESRSKSLHIGNESAVIMSNRPSDLTHSSENGNVRLVGSDKTDSQTDTLPVVLFSSYSENSVSRSGAASPEDGDDLVTWLGMSYTSNQHKLSPPVSLDASNPIPGFLTGLSLHDKMLIHTHLTYMPQVIYGLGDRAIYCPVRQSCVWNILRAPVGLIWVLVSLEMFFETVHRSTARKNTILHRKSLAYQLMSKSLRDKSQSNDHSVLVGSIAAACAELYCGDPKMALTHINGIAALVKLRGGKAYIEQLEWNVSLPIFAIFSYRTIIQDNLTTTDSFERARDSVMEKLRAMMTWNADLAKTLTTEPTNTRHASPPQDEGFDGNYDLNEALAKLQEARRRAFMHHPILRKFVVPDFETQKPGEATDHFIVLYNLNCTLVGFGTNFKRAAGFIDDLLTDIELGGSTKGADSSLRISGAMRLIIHRQSQLYPNQPSTGVVRAWDALHALEVMKLLPPDTRKSVRLTLHLLLTGQVSGGMTVQQDFDAMESLMTTEWLRRHPGLSLSSGG